MEVPDITITYKIFPSVALKFAEGEEFTQESIDIGESKDYIIKATVTKDAEGKVLWASIDMIDKEPVKRK